MKRLLLRSVAVKRTINGESWGVYASAQQFNKELLAENDPSAKGARWKVNGSPLGRGRLEYLGDNIDDYKRTFSLKTNDNTKDWKALVKLCKTLNETPPDQLEAALAPMRDIDEALFFFGTRQRAHQLRRLWDSRQRLRGLSR